jgi:D-amino peptidase
MNVLIMADMEGVSGITNWDQVNGGAPLYEECRKLYTLEVNAAVRGAKRAGARRIVAVDCHGAGKGWNFNSFIPELMECEWVAGHTWGRYTELLEEGCDAALMVGMHAKANTPDGVLCHTISTTTWDNLSFNGKSVGEFGINTALCGHYGVPVVLITGDEATCREGTDLLGKGLHTAAVKKGLTRYSARHIPPAQVRQMIEDAAHKSLGGPIRTKPYDPGKPCEITIDLSTVDTANQFMGRHGVEVVGPLKVISRGRDWMRAWNQVWKW